MNNYTVVLKKVLYVKFVKTKFFTIKCTKKSIKTYIFYISTYLLNVKNAKMLLAEKNVIQSQRSNLTN